MRLTEYLINFMIGFLVAFKFAWNKFKTSEVDLNRKLKLLFSRAISCQNKPARTAAGGKSPTSRLSDNPLAPKINVLNNLIVIDVQNNPCPWQPCWRDPSNNRCPSWLTFVFRLDKLNWSLSPLHHLCCLSFPLIVSGYKLSDSKQNQVRIVVSMI